MEENIELVQIKDYGKVYDNIKNIAVKYVETHNIKSLVLGISGGIDSTLVALIARQVCNETGIKFIGRNLPIRPKNAGGLGWESNNIAIQLGSELCDDFSVVDLSNEANVLWETLNEGPDDETPLKYKIRRGNLFARIRMITLYDLAQKNEGLVLSTDNWTEYLLGFWTLHGDVGDYGMIQSLWKTEVYELTEWLAKNNSTGTNFTATIFDSINKKPTDGLGISGDDLEQLGANTYKEVDLLLREYRSILMSTGPKNFHRLGLLNQCPVINRHTASAFKRNHPINIKRIELLSKEE